MASIDSRDRRRWHAIHKKEAIRRESGGAEQIGERSAQGTRRPRPDAERIRCLLAPERCPRTSRAAPGIVEEAPRAEHIGHLDLDPRRCSGRRVEFRRASDARLPCPGAAAPNTKSRRRKRRTGTAGVWRRRPRTRPGARAAARCACRPASLPATDRSPPRGTRARRRERPASPVRSDVQENAALPGRKADIRDWVTRQGPPVSPIEQAAGGDQPAFDERIDGAAVGAAVEQGTSGVTGNVLRGRAPEVMGRWERRRVERRARRERLESHARPGRRAARRPPPVGCRRTGRPDCRRTSAAPSPSIRLQATRRSAGADDTRVTRAASAAQRTSDSKNASVVLRNSPRM